MNTYLCSIPFILSLSFACSLAASPFSTYQETEFYHDHSMQQLSVAYEGLTHYSFIGNEAILDIGSAGGKVSANLAGRVPNGYVVATEMRGEKAFEFSQKNYPQTLYSNLFFIKNDFLNSHYTNEFDLAVSFSALHWFKDQEIILKKIYDALKVEGQILFTIPARPSVEILELFTELLSKEEWKDYFADYEHPRKKFTPEEYQSLLVEIGFEPIEISLKEREYAFENKRALINWFKSFTPLLSYLPEDQHEDFLIDFANLYAEYFPIEKDGTLLFIQNELFIQAIK